MYVLDNVKELYIYLLYYVFIFKWLNIWNSNKFQNVNVLIHLFFPAIIYFFTYLLYFIIYAIIYLFQYLISIWAQRTAAIHI